MKWGVDTFLRGWWGKNQGFMLISDIHSSTVIGCGGELKQSEYGMDGTDGVEGADGEKFRVLC